MFGRQAEESSVTPDLAMSADATDPDLTCAICLEPYVEPLTLQCGHSFCRACLLQSTKLAPDGRSCPQCRAVIDGMADLRHHPFNESLAAKVSATVPAAKLDERRAQAARTLDALAERNAGVYPVFIMRCTVGPRPGEWVSESSAQPDGPRTLSTHTTPGSPVNLNLFEPRYRVLIRRAWEGERKFIWSEASPAAGASALLVSVRSARSLSLCAFC